MRRRLKPAGLTVPSTGRRIGPDFCTHIGGFVKLGRRTRRRLRIAGLSLAGVALVGFTAAAVLAGMNPPEPPPVSEKIAAAYRAGATLPPSPKPTPAPTYTKAPKLTFSEGTRAVFFGDSWTLGLGIDPLQAFPYVTASTLGLDAEVFGEAGTGYLNTGIKNQGTYLTRMRQLAGSDAGLLVIQGSLNDQNQNPVDLTDAMRKTLDEAKKKFPRAQIVVVGPTKNLKTDPGMIGHIDSLMQQVARERSINYISPVDLEWTTPETVETIIDAGTNHPSLAGHKTLAADLVAALNALR